MFLAHDDLEFLEIDYVQTNISIFLLIGSKARDIMNQILTNNMNFLM